MLDEGAKYCPLIQKTCQRDKCVFWVGSEESIQKSCAVVVIAQQLDLLARKGPQGRL